MYYIVESEKSFEQAATDLDAAVKRNGFGVLHVHDIGATLRGKGVEFANQCRQSDGNRYALEHGATVPHLGLYRRR